MNFGLATVSQATVPKARLLEIYPHELAELWLESHNAHLGARPIDVLQLRGAAPVIEAIDALTRKNRSRSTKMPASPVE